MDHETPAMDGHSLLLRFDSDNPEFSRGFELGRLWSLLRTCPDALEAEYVRVENAEMVLRLAEATGREVTADELDDRWMAVSFGAVDEVLEVPDL